MRSAEQKEEALAHLEQARGLLERTIVGVIDENDEQTFFSSILARVTLAQDCWDGGK